MKLRMCNCKHCRRGRKSAFQQAKIKAKKHSFRTATRYVLRSGAWELLPQVVAIGYTD